MVIDHTAASVVLWMLWDGRLGEEWSQVYSVMRGIGRIAFPIFCFLLVEGFCHTSNRKRYMGRLFLFALISEIPFNLGLKQSIFAPESQNVFATLFIGMCVLCALRALQERFGNSMIYYLTAIGSIFAGMLVTGVLHTDYSIFGVLVIVSFYLGRNNRPLAAATGLFLLIMCFADELPAVFAFPLILFYNGERGKKIKYFFYAFYPVHLLLLFLICRLLGIYGPVL